MIALVMMCLALPAQAQVPAIENLMSAEEQRASGIDQLSAQQLEALNAWLQRFAAGDVVAQSVAPEAAPAAPPAPSPRYGQRVVVDETVRSRILGEFSGWTGKTRFELENGQLWEQRRPGRHRVTLTDPEVIIRKNLFGAWDLELVGDGASIGVRRLR
jgi:hypothetical protein